MHLLENKETKTQIVHALIVLCSSSCTAHRLIWQRTSDWL